MICERGGRVFSQYKERRGDGKGKKRKCHFLRRILDNIRLFLFPPPLSYMHKHIYSPSSITSFLPSYHLRLASFHFYSLSHAPTLYTSLSPFSTPFPFPFSSSLFSLFPLCSLFASWSFYLSSSFLRSIL